jgi:glycosyltransferase 2 family protein
MAQLLGDQVPAVWAELSGARLDLVVAAFVLIAISNGVAGLFWRAILGAAGVAVSRSAAIESWSLSALAKYGLGAPAQYATRAYLATSGGSPKSRVLLGFGLELAAITSAGVAVLLAVAPLAGASYGLPPSVGWAGPPVALGLFFGLPLVWPRAAADVRTALLAALLNWLLVGAALFLLLGALRSVDPLLLPNVLAAVIVGTLSGLYALTPFGLGVREAVMALVLAPAVPPVTAASAALLHRLCTVVAELLWGLFALALLRRRRASS